MTSYQNQPPPPAGFYPGPAGYPQQPGYPPQPGYPGGFPQQPGPGYPPPYGGGVPPGGAFPPPPAFHMPPPADMHRAESGYGQADGFGFSDKTIRMGFIRKVYSILMCQIAITVAIIALFTFHTGTKIYVQQHPGLWWLALIFMFATLITLACCGDVRRKSPMNYICLTIFTLAEGFMLGCATSLYKKEEIFLAAAITLVLVVSLTIFTFQTKIDFTMCGGVLCVGMVLLVVLGVVCFFFPSKTMKLILASAGALIFCCFIVYDTQIMIGGTHKYAISPEEYVFAALSLYIDIINLFMCLLQIIGLTSDD